MSEICHNCPINSDDPDANTLNAVAAGMTDTGKTVGDSWMQTAFNLFDSYDRDEQELAESMFQAKDLSPEKIDQARKCAEQILWKTCDFNNLT